MIVVLDYDKGKVYLYDNPKQEPGPEFRKESKKMIEEQGHKNYDWMVTYEPLENRCKREHLLIGNKRIVKRVEL